MYCFAISIEQIQILFPEGITVPNNSNRQICESNTIWKKSEDGVRCNTFFALSTELQTTGFTMEETKLPQYNGIH